MISRRRFFKGVAASVVAAPAIIKIAPLMRIYAPRPRLLTLAEITREAIRNFRNTNAYLSLIDAQYDSVFSQPGALIGTSLRIRLPSGYALNG